MTVTQDQAISDRCGDRGRRNAFLVSDMDFHQAVAVVEFQRPLCRDVGGIVQIDTEKLALGCHHADDAKTQAADTYPCAERVFCAKQLVPQLAAQYDLGPSGAGAFARQKTADVDCGTEDLGKVGVHAINRRAPHAAVAVHFRISPYRRRCAGDVG